MLPIIPGPNSNLTEGAFHQTYSWRIEKGAKVGKYNGLTLLLDAETYDYWYQVGQAGWWLVVVIALQTALLVLYTRLATIRGQQTNTYTGPI